MTKSKIITVLFVLSFMLVLSFQSICAVCLDSDSGYLVDDNSNNLQDGSNINVNYNQDSNYNGNNLNDIESKNSLNCHDASNYCSDSSISDDIKDDAGVSCYSLNSMGDESLKNAIQSKNVKGLPYEKDSISIHVDNLSCNVNDLVSINVQFNASDVDEGVLLFYVDDDIVATHNLSHSDNTLEFDTYGYSVGNHSIFVEYTASLIYESAYANANLEINKHQTQLNDFECQFTQDNDINVSFELTSDDESISGADINIYHDGELLKTVTSSNALVNFIIPARYNYEIINIKYEGDEYYDQLDSYQLININRKHLTLYAPSITGYHSSVVDVYITINNDTRLVDGTLDFYVDDLLIYSNPVDSSNPVIQLDLSEYLEGTYGVKLAYVDSDVYDDAYYTTTLKVNKIKTVLYSNNVSAYRNTPVTFKASVYNYVDDTDEGLIEFFIDDESIQTASITNNTVSYDYVLPDTLDYGIHELKIIYYGTDRYNGSMLLANLTLNRYKSTMYIKNTTLDDDGLININLNLYSYNQVVDDGIVECYVDGNLVTTADVINNTAKIVLPEVYVPNQEYEVLLEYKNSDYFNDSTLTASLQQNKTITTTSISKYLSNKNILNITSYVYAKDYSNISEGSVGLYINDTLIAICDVINNTINTSYDMAGYSSGNYTLYVEYSGSKRYAPSNNTTTVEKVIHPQSIYINTQSTIRATPLANITIKANLTDYESNLINDTIDAIIIIDNQTINAKFTQGLLEFNITAPSQTGKTQIQIITANTTNYKNATRNITLNVNRNSTYISSPNTISSLKLEKIKLNFTLNDNNGLVKTKTPVQIKIGNKTIYQGFFNQGILAYDLKLDDTYTQNQYNLTVIAGQTTSYAKSNKTITLKLNNRKTFIKSENIYSKKGDQLIFKAVLYDSITQKQINKKIPVVIKLNDVSILTTNTTNGQILATYPNNFNNTNYTITIKSATTGIYESSQWQGNLVNSRDYIKVSANNIYANANNTIRIKATIHKDDKLITERIPVAIKLNNLTIATLNVTDSKINYEYKLPDNLSQKEYNITIVTADTHEYIQSTTNFKLYVSKNYQQINTQNIKAKANQKVTIKANITDKKGNIIRTNELVNIKIAGITIANLNANEGIIEYNYTLPNLKKGYYDLILKTGETNCYYHATAQKTIEVE